MHRDVTPSTRDQRDGLVAHRPPLGENNGKRVMNNISANVPKDNDFLADLRLP